MIDVKVLVDDAIVIIIDTPESIARFKELVFRATNLWPDATPEIKIFADQITNSDWLGMANSTVKLSNKALQDYSSQDSSPQSKQTKVSK